MFLKDTKMNVKNSLQTERLGADMFYSEDMAVLNDLEIFQRARAAKYPLFVHFLELRVPTGTVKKSSFQILVSNIEYFRALP